MPENVEHFVIFRIKKSSQFTIEVGTCTVLLFVKALRLTFTFDLTADPCSTTTENQFPGASGLWSPDGGWTKVCNNINIMYLLYRNLLSAYNVDSRC